MAFNTEAAQIKCIAQSGYTDPIAGTGAWAYNETRLVSEEQGSILASIYDKFSRVSDSPAVMGIADTASGAKRIFLGSNELRKVGAKKNFGTSLCDWQSATGSLALTSAGAGSSAALDSSVTLFGKPTLKCTFSSAASDTYIATFTPTNPVRLRDIKTIQVPVLFTSNSQHASSPNGGIGAGGSPFQIWIGTSNSKSIRLQGYFTNLQPGAWTTLSFGRQSPSIITNTISELDTAGVTVTSIKIVQATNNSAAINYPVWVGEIRADTSVDRGRVSIVMDGEYSSQYSILFPLMQKYGLLSSLAITTADIGGSGRMTAAQIDEMYKAGHEVINHTYDSTKTNGYVDSTQWVAASDITEDIRAQWAYMKSQGWTRGIGYGVWGYNYGFNGTVLQSRQQLVASALKAAGVQAMRKSVPYNSGTLGSELVPLCNVPVDPLVVCGAAQITNTTTPAEINNIIDQAEATGQWAIITVHRAVMSAPSSLEMLASDFDSWMSYLSSRVSSGGVAVSPFGETYDEIFK